MADYMQIHSADGAPFEIPLHHRATELFDPRAPFDDDFTPPVVSIDEYYADQPNLELNITELRCYSDTLAEPVKFVLEGFAMVEEEGLWTLTIYHRDYGPPSYDLQYWATLQFGEPVRNAQIFRWDHEKEEMVAD